MENLTTYSDYKEFKEKLDQELQNNAEGFVRIGYLLKRARDTDILFASGYKSVNEFAEREYGIDKSVVSRFIRINDRFSKGGYSPQLKEEYREFGYTKLAIMLQLPDEINEELSPSMSKEEINQIKKAVYEEKSITDIERMLEESEEMPLLEMCIRQLWKEKPDVYLEMTCSQGEGSEESVNKMIPNEVRTFTVNLQRIGAVMICLQRSVPTFKLVKMRTLEKETYPKAELIKYIKCWEKTDAIEKWEKLYGEAWQEKDKEPLQGQITPAQGEVAPVQPEKREEQLKEKKPQMALDSAKAAGLEEKQVAGWEKTQVVEVIDEWEKLYESFLKHIEEANIYLKRKKYKAARQYLNRAIIVVDTLSQEAK